MKIEESNFGKFNISQLEILPNGNYLAIIYPKFRLEVFNNNLFMLNSSWEVIWQLRQEDYNLNWSKLPNTITFFKIVGPYIIANVFSGIELTIDFNGKIVSHQFIK